MKWCTLSFDKKGIFVYWSWCSSYWSGDFDDGESYDLDIPFDWWAKSWEDAKKDFDNTSPSFIIPFFFAYLFLGVQTIIAIIKRKRSGKKIWQQEQDFFASHYWDDELNDWVEKKEIEK